MAYSKVAYDGHTLIDLTQDTAVESDVADGKYFHKSNGERVQGTSGKVIVQGSDSSAFLIRHTAGETLAPLDCDRKSVLKKLGNTVGVNQLIQPSAWRTRTYNNVTVTNNNDGSFSVSGTCTGSAYIDITASAPGNVGHPHIFYSSEPLTFRYSGVIFTGYGIITPTSGTLTNIALSIVNGTTYSATVWAGLSDLSLWYGSTDRIPADLLSHPENWGRYYSGSLAYNAGTLESADGTGMKSIGRNVWDEEWELGNINSSGVKYADNSLIRSKNYIEVVPNETYYGYIGVNTSGIYAYFYDSDKNFISGGLNIANNTFTVPANARYMLFKLHGNYGTTYKNDITVSLYYPGESGYDQYYPYSVLAEADTGSEVLRSAGAVADEKTPDGTITRRVGYVDLGTLTWTTVQAGYYLATPTGMATVVEPPYSNRLAGATCAKYPPDTQESTAFASRTDKTWIRNSNAIYIKDTDYATAAAFKAAMSGVYLNYELATPTTEQGTAFTGLQKVDGHGIEMVTGGTTGIPVLFTAQYLKTINAAPTDTIVITENGSHDVAMYAGAIVDVSGGGTPSLQSKTVNLDSNAPSTVYPGTGYNGLSSVSFNTAGINAANIKAGTSVCGVPGTYAALTYDVQTATPPIGPVTPMSFNIGWRPDVLVFDWSEETENEGETVINYYRRSLTADGSIESGHDTVTFTSTGYTIFMNGTYWNDYSERFGPMTITAIKLS